MEVSHVSRRWRSVAVNAGALWTNMSVTCRRSSEVICLYLKRSGSYPLYVTFNLDGRPRESFNISPFRNNIIPHIHRIRQFFLQSVKEFNPTLFDDPLFRSHLPQLRRLIIYWSPCYSVYADNVAPGVFTGGTPLLTSVELQGDGAIRLRPSFAAVTTLMLGAVNTMRQWNAIHFHDFLAAAPQLHSLCLDGEVIGSWKKTEPVAIPSLISLNINFWNSDPIFAPCIVTTLMTPNLESLTLHGVNKLVTIGLASVLESQHRYPFLQSVHFYGLSIRDSYDQFMTVLTMLPTVTHLSLV